MELNAKGRPILPLKHHDGDDVIVDAKELLEWRRNFIDEIERLRMALLRCRVLNHTHDEREHCAMCIGIDEALGSDSAPTAEGQKNG